MNDSKAQLNGYVSGTGIPTLQQVIEDMKNRDLSADFNDIAFEYLDDNNVKDIEAIEEPFADFLYTDFLTDLDARGIDVIEDIDYYEYYDDMFSKEVDGYDYVATIDMDLEKEYEKFKKLGDGSVGDDENELILEFKPDYSSDSEEKKRISEVDSQAKHITFDSEQLREEYYIVNNKKKNKKRNIGDDYEPYPDEPDYEPGLDYESDLDDYDDYCLDF